jgi:hypothetical protein
MERLIANLAGKTRRAKLNGRDHIVAPLTLIVPGILDGSKGALFYSEEELGKNFEAWNHIPIVVNHPEVNGGHVTARDPDVLNAQGIGVLLHTKSNGKLTAEGWFDISRTALIDNRILDSLEDNQTIELSTGLYTDNFPNEEKATFNGESYDYVARNYRPDHLAILPDNKGACSVQDGCGVNVNKKTKPKKEGSNMSLSEEQRKNHVDYIIANCEMCAEEDRERFEAMDDKTLVSNKGIIEKAKENEAIVGKVRKGFEIEHEDGSKTTATFNAKSEWEYKIEKAKVEDPPKKKEKEVDPVANKKEEKPKTTEEWLDSAPKEIKSAVQNAMTIEAREKAHAIDFLTANLEDEAKEGMVELLATKSLEELQQLSLLTPKATEQTVPTVHNYLGASVVSPKAKVEVDKDDILELPTYNWSDEKQTA